MGNICTRKVLFEKTEKPKEIENRVGVQMFRPVPIEQEPKRRNRFVLKFPEEFEIESYSVQMANRPLSCRLAD